MITLTGVTLDYDKMLADKWSLYFTSGVYEAEGLYRQKSRNV